MITQREIDFWLNNETEIAYDCIEITHPSFSKSYRFVRNYPDTLIVTHEDGNKYSYEYCPFTLQLSNSSDNLDQQLNIGIGEVGGELSSEILRLRNGSYSHIPPTLIYRVYTSNYLTEPLKVFDGLQIINAKRKKDAVVFTAQPKNLNNTETGIKYTLKSFPSLKGFI
jgi:hypothetical protein